MKDLIGTADSAHGKNGGEAGEGDDNDDQGRRNDEEEGDDTDAGSDTSDDEFEDRFVELEEDLANVIADVHDMGAFSFPSQPDVTCDTRSTMPTIHSDGTGHFSHLNYTGFIKIVKKHDVRCSPSLLLFLLTDDISSLTNRNVLDIP